MWKQQFSVQSVRLQCRFPGTAGEFRFWFWFLHRYDVTKLHPHCDNESSGSCTLSQQHFNILKQIQLIPVAVLWFVDQLKFFTSSSTNKFASSTNSKLSWQCNLWRKGESKVEEAVVLNRSVWCYLLCHRINSVKEEHFETGWMVQIHLLNKLCKRCLISSRAPELFLPFSVTLNWVKWSWEENAVSR